VTECCVRRRVVYGVLCVNELFMQCCEWKLSQRSVVYGEVLVTALHCVLRCRSNQIKEELSPQPGSLLKVSYSMCSAH
jgi:hypothetical protein